MGDDQVSPKLSNEDRTELDFGEIYRQISTAYHLDPKQIGNLTLTLFLVYLKEDSSPRLEQADAHKRVMLSRKRRLSLENFKQPKRIAWQLKKLLQ